MVSGKLIRVALSAGREPEDHTRSQRSRRHESERAGIRFKRERDRLAEARSMATSSWSPANATQFRPPLPRRKHQAFGEQLPDQAQLFRRRAKCASRFRDAARWRARAEDSRCSGTRPAEPVRPRPSESTAAQYLLAECGRILARRIERSRPDQLGNFATALASVTVPPSSSIRIWRQIAANDARATHPR